MVLEKPEREIFSPTLWPPCWNKCRKVDQLNDWVNIGCCGFSCCYRVHSVSIIMCADDALKDVSLDKFLARNTSEDNVSFSEIMAEAEKKRRLKHAWLYEKVNEQLEVCAAVCICSGPCNLQCKSTQLRKYTVSQKRSSRHIVVCLHQILTNLENSFTSALSMKFAVSQCSGSTTP